MDTGVLRVWNEERGFGFIAPTGGGRELFVHVSAFPRDGGRPTVGERVSYEVVTGKNGKPQAARVQRLAFAGAAARPDIRSERPRPPRKSRVPLAAGIVVVAFAAFAVTRYQARSSPEPRPIVPASTAAVEPALSPLFHCDGRTQCSQMTSCSEARYFVAHCPDVKMDGNHDGIPCERQWCTSPSAK
jgi:cold shock CspA family protein